jgi:hypothetical protein
MHINNLKYLPDSCPEYVSGEFNCSRNDLLSLNNSPKEVVSNFRAMKIIYLHLKMDRKSRWYNTFSK